LHCSSNKLTATGLNTLFGTLHNVSGNRQISGSGNQSIDHRFYESHWREFNAVIIGNNPGTASCNRSIATSKGWVVED
ncbi:MAG: hypothetical protein LBG92_12865, partial [Prevotellaceae bacterium]|jgi:hypothetical protein|nr:hypothetical protein [Prevotellaceae bacterium]